MLTACRARQGSAACRRLEEVDVFARAVEEMDANVRLLQEHLESEDARAWEPRKLSVSLMSAHGNLIRSVDHLYDTYGADLKDLCLQFPEIVVVGGESVGKSSLLEKLAGVPIFPRGDGITTRVPFRLRLHHRSAREMAALLAQVRTSAASAVHAPGPPSAPLMSKRLPSVALPLPRKERLRGAPHAACHPQMLQPCFCRSTLYRPGCGSVQTTNW